MRIDGKWLWCDDDIARRVIYGEILAASGCWEEVEFLLDTGADRTVLSSTTLAKTALQPLATQTSISGLGGLARSVLVETAIRFTREASSRIVFHGQFVAVTELEALDISVLGRDIIGLFAVIADQPGNVVSLLRQPHSYRIE